MLRAELQKIVQHIMDTHPLFEGKGFIKEERTVGGFKGITNQYLNYFFIATDNLDIDKFNFEKDHEVQGYGIFGISTDFEIIFQTKCPVPNFLEVMIWSMESLADLKLQSATDDTELIYTLETGDDYKQDNYQLYRLKYRLEAEINLGASVCCLDETCFDANCCK